MDSVSSDASIKASGNAAALLPQAGAPDETAMDSAFAGMLSGANVPTMPLQHNNMLPVVSLQKPRSSHGSASASDSATSSSQNTTTATPRAVKTADPTPSTVKSVAPAISWKKVKAVKFQDVSAPHDAKAKPDQITAPAVAAADQNPAPAPVVAVSGNTNTVAPNPTPAPAVDTVSVAADVAINNVVADPLAPAVASATSAPAPAADPTNDANPAPPVAQGLVSQTPAPPIVLAASAALAVSVPLATPLQASAPAPAPTPTPAPAPAPAPAPVAVNNTDTAAVVDPNAVAAPAANVLPPPPQSLQQVAATPVTLVPASTQPVLASKTGNAPAVQTAPVDILPSPVIAADAVSIPAPVVAKDDKIDLKPLTTLFARPVAPNAIAQNANAMTGDALAANDLNTPSSLTLAASPVASAPTAKTVQPDAPKSNWVDSFLNLFSTPATSTPTGPVALPGAVAASFMSSAQPSTDDLMSDNGQGQNANARDAGTGALPNNSMPLTAQAAHASDPYNFASQLSALRATQGGMTGLPSAVEQVVLQMGKLAKDGSGDMTIQLRPAELGRIDVKLSVDANGRVQGTVTADNPATLHLLSKDVGSLERALQEAGLRADSGSLQFNLRGDSQQGSSSADNGANARGNGDNNSANTVAVPAADDETEIYYLTPGRVNLRV